MGILSRVNNWITSTQQTATGHVYKQMQQFVLLNEQQQKVDVMTLCTDNMQPLKLFIQVKQHCSVLRSEMVKDDYLYKIHCKDHKGSNRVFTLQRLS